MGTSASCVGSARGPSHLDLDPRRDGVGEDQEPDEPQRRRSLGDGAARERERDGNEADAERDRRRALAQAQAPTGPRAGGLDLSRNMLDRGAHWALIGCAAAVLDPTLRSSASTTAGSNCVPAWRRSSASASSSGNVAASAREEAQLVGDGERQFDHVAAVASGVGVVRLDDVPEEKRRFAVRLPELERVVDAPLPLLGEAREQPDEREHDTSTSTRCCSAR
jgi:hypothetical protein